MKTKSNTTLILIECALMIALSTVLSEFVKIPLLYGGSVTAFSQLPIIAISYRHGIKWGLISGFVMSVIQLIFGLENLSYVTGISSYIILIFADYLVAFTVLGLGGIFRNKMKQMPALVVGGILVSFIRFICHFISGITIWSGYAPEGTPVWIYSLTYNGSYMLPELLITVLGAILISLVLDFNQPDLIRKKAKSA